MSHTVLAEIVLPVVVVVALALWIFATYRTGQPGYSRRSGASLPDQESGPGADLREPSARELDESGTDYVDFGAPERARRS
jgi:hypothetical protein